MPKGIYDRSKAKQRGLMDLTGQRFGRLTVISLAKKYKGVGTWNCKCDCGVEKEILGSSLTRENKSTCSCGCLQKKATEHLGSAEKVNFLRNGLRGLWLKWPPRYHTLNSARVARGQYLCKGYEKDPHVVGRKGLNVDHIIPIGKLTNWEEHIEKLFCASNNLQVLCKECHLAKTRVERKKDY